MTPTQNQDPRIAELLSQMNSIIEPEASFQLAPGWWGLITLLVALLVLLSFLAINHYRQNKYRREALALLDQIPPQANVEYLQSINQLLKRTCLAFTDRATLCNLYGSTWTEFLHSHRGKAQLVDSLTPILSEGLYQPAPQFDPAQLRNFARSWIKQHSAKPTSTGGANV